MRKRGRGIVVVQRHIAELDVIGSICLHLLFLPERRRY
jgi:hypothetical protein